jgi:hypothetical protein
MSVSNNNWVCFACRTSQRHQKLSGRVPVCPDCGADCFCLGYKVEVPRREAIRAWHRLQDECRRRVFSRIKSEQRWEVRRKHDLEKEIVRMERLGENKDRARQIKRLKIQLAAFASRR